MTSYTPLLVSKAEELVATEPGCPTLSSEAQMHDQAHSTPISPQHRSNTSSSSSRSSTSSTRSRSSSGGSSGQPRSFHPNKSFKLGASHHRASKKYRLLHCILTYAAARAHTHTRTVNNDMVLVTPPPHIYALLKSSSSSSKTSLREFMKRAATPVLRIPTGCFVKAVVTALLMGTARDTFFDDEK